MIIVQRRKKEFWCSFREKDSFKRDSGGAGIVAKRVLAALLLVQFPADVPGTQQMMIQVVESPPLMWETCMELQALGFGLIES